MTGLNATGVVAFVLLDIAIILVAARLCGAAAKKVGQPSVVGEIIAGVLLGPSLLGATIFAWDGVPSWLNCGPALEFLTATGGTAPAPSITACLFPPQAQTVLNVLGQIALLLFMFLVGLELDFSKIKGKGGPIAIVAFGVVAVPVALGFALQPVLFTETFTGGGDASALAFNVFIGATISVTALPVMARILQEKGLASTDLAAIGIAAAAVVTILMFLLVAVAGGIAAGASAGALLGKIAAALVYLALMWYVVRPALEPLARRYEERAAKVGAPTSPHGWSDVDEFTPSGIGWVLTHSMFAWIVVLVMASGFVAHVLGINVIVGGFMAGLVLPVREGLIRDMTAELFDVTVIVLLPIFLAFSGLRTDFTQLSVGALPGILVFIAVCVIAKVASGAVFGRMAGLTWAEGNALGALMNCRGLLPLVVALIGLQQGVISPQMQVGIVLMALVTTIMTGPLFDKLNPAKAAATAAEPGT